jgi:NAD(P)-dependent dehydrogenase (short-subunit alcohol dehydrogenase family)
MTTSSDAKVVVITGCSSGFGLLTAARLAVTGHQVFATMRDLSKRAALEDEFKRRNASAKILQLDVTDRKSIEKAIKEIGEKAGYIDVLVNNAGYGVGGMFEDLTEEEIRLQFETNFFGVQNTIRTVIPLMRTQRRGRIINLSSVSGFSAPAGFSAYSASKWALEAFSESLREELKFFGIDVLLVEPGTYKTKIFYENARYARHFNDPKSPYYPISKFLEKKTREFVDDCHKDPEDVAHLIEKLVTQKNPPFRNIPDIESHCHSVLRRFLPFNLYSNAYRKILFSGLRWPAEKS